MPRGSPFVTSHGGEFFGPANDRHLAEEMVAASALLSASDQVRSVSRLANDGAWRPSVDARTCAAVIGDSNGNEGEQPGRQQCERRSSGQRDCQQAETEPRVH